MDKIKKTHVPRAARACTRCRRQKTRCFPSAETSACLRCFSLGKDCSLVEVDRPDSFVQSSDHQAHNGAKPVVIKGTDQGNHKAEGGDVEQIKGDIKRILTMLGRQQQGVPMEYEDNVIPINSPFSLIEKSVSFQNTPLTMSSLLHPIPSFDEPSNVLSLGIITQDEAITLIDSFKNNYSRWITLPSCPTVEFIEDIKQSSPLFLTTICLTSLRYNITGLNYDTYLNLVQQLKLELHEAISKSRPRNMNYLKALVILSVYGYSLTSDGLILDPWFLSGIAVKQFLTLNMTHPLLSDQENTTPEDHEETLSNFRIWNHICLVHLYNSIFSNRMCILDSYHLDQSRRSIESPQATNFDGRMISEISLQLLLYNFVQTGGGFQAFEQDMKQWYDQWNYLFKQPNLQFVEFGYHYCYLVAFHHFYLHEDEIRDPDVLNKMLYHSLKVLNHILGLNDKEYFSHLSDQIHLCTFYSALLFMKLIQWCRVYNPTYSHTELQGFVKKVEGIRERFESVSTMQADLVGMLGRGIDELMGL